MRIAAPITTPVYLIRFFRQSKYLQSKGDGLCTSVVTLPTSDMCLTVGGGVTFLPPDSLLLKLPIPDGSEG